MPPEIILANDPAHREKVPLGDTLHHNPHDNRYHDLLNDATNMGLMTLDNGDLPREWCRQYDNIPRAAVGASESARAICHLIAFQIDEVISVTIWPFFEKALESKYGRETESDLHPLTGHEYGNRKIKLNVPFLAHGFVYPTNAWRQPNKVLYGVELPHPQLQTEKIAITWTPDNRMEVPNWKDASDRAGKPSKPPTREIFKALIKAQYTPPIVPGPETE